MSFLVEGFEQESRRSAPPNDDDKPDDDDGEEDDLDSIHDGDLNMDVDKTIPPRSSASGRGIPSEKQVTPKKGSKTVLMGDEEEIDQLHQLQESMNPEATAELSSQQAAWLGFMDQIKDGDNNTDCSILLREMEMANSNEEDALDEEDILVETDVMTHQPLDKPCARQLLEEFSECVSMEAAKEKPAEANQKRKTVWGPIQKDARPRRYVDDGKTILQRAEELARYKNLEVAFKCKPGNSFAFSDNDHLHDIANQIDLNMGCNNKVAIENIEIMKGRDLEKITSFKDSNPELSLPSNLECDVDVNVPSQMVVKEDDNINLSDFPPLNGVEVKWSATLPLKGDGECSSQWCQVVSKSLSSDNKQLFPHDRCFLEH